MATIGNPHRGEFAFQFENNKQFLVTQLSMRFCLAQSNETILLANVRGPHV